MRYYKNIRIIEADRKNEDEITVKEKLVMAICAFSIIIFALYWQVIVYIFM